LKLFSWFFSSKRWKLLLILESERKLSFPEYASFPCVVDRIRMGIPIYPYADPWDLHVCKQENSATEQTEIVEKDRNSLAMVGAYRLSLPAAKVFR
jgi:hypothetical protein